MKTEADFSPQELAEFRAGQDAIQAGMLRKKDERETQARQAKANADNQERVWKDRDAMLSQIAADRTTILGLQQRVDNLEEAIIEILRKEVAAPLIAASSKHRHRMSRILKNYQQPKD